MMMVHDKAPWEGWVAVQAAAKRYGVHFQTIRNWANRGWIEKRKVGNGVTFVPEAVLRELLERQRGYIEPPTAAGDEDGRH